MGTKYEGAEEERLALDTFTKLTRGLDSFVARSHSVLPENGLSTSQFAVLDVLYFLGPMCQKELAHRLLKTGGNLTMVIDNLEKSRYVERRRQVDDRRFIDVHLLKKGSELMDRIFPTHAENIALQMSVLSAEEQQTLGQLCKKLGRSVV